MGVKVLWLLWWTQCNFWSLYGYPCPRHIEVYSTEAHCEVVRLAHGSWSHLNRGNNDKCAGKYGEHECKEGDSTMRGPLPEPVKWVILSGLLIGSVGMIFIGKVLGWFR